MCAYRYVQGPAKEGSRRYIDDVIGYMIEHSGGTLMNTVITFKIQYQTMAMRIFCIGKTAWTHHRQS